MRGDGLDELAWIKKALSNVEGERCTTLYHTELKNKTLVPFWFVTIFQIIKLILISDRDDPSKAVKKHRPAAPTKPDKALPPSLATTSIKCL